ncbi:hypothetical protein [Ralstonia sp. CP]|uniref:hypothetical protein n=1 Tax=Ralstonia sp. CP TaxID=3231757 RepID=UPI00345BFFAB
MTDREMLEKAAKAADLEVECAFTSGDLHVWTNRKLQLLRIWNPLKDDGDALRLAAKLNLDIRFSWYDDLTAVFVGGTWDDAPEAVHELFERDVTAATRLAIVRAAAAIGESHE